MLFRVFWPSPAEQTGVLVGWWLTEEGYVLKDAGEAPCAAFVACTIRSSISEAEPQLLKLNAVFEGQGISCLAILGDSQAGGSLPSNLGPRSPGSAVIAIRIGPCVFPCLGQRSPRQPRSKSSCIIFPHDGVS